MTKVILLNGPRQVGKDFIADEFISLNRSARKLPVTWPLKLAAMAEHGIPPSTVRILDTAKDRPIGNTLQGPHVPDAVEAIEGWTPREIYIAYGDRMRAEMGDDYFAQLWASHADQYRGYEYIVVPDVRFQPEVDVASQVFGRFNTYLVRVKQADFDWRTDIGSYLKHTVSFDFNNDDHTSKADVGKRLVNIVKARTL